MATTLAQLQSDLAAMQAALTKLIIDVNNYTPAPVPPTPVSTESIDGATITSTTGSLIDANKNLWTLATGTGLVVMQNGKAAGFSANVTLLGYWGHVIYQTNGSGWWSWINSAWTTASDPRIAPPPPTPAAGTIQINLGASLGAISPYVWGVDSEGLNAPGIEDYGAAIQPGFQATWRAQNWRLFRFNTQGSADQWIAPSKDRTNFAAGWPTFWKNVTGPTDLTGNRLLFTMGSGNNFPYGASQVTAIANWFKSIGMEIFFWEIWNECDSDILAGNWAPAYTACRNALKAINPLYQVGAPCTTYARGDCNAIAHNLGVDFAGFHCYLEGGPSFSSNSDMFARTISRAAADIQIMRQTFPISVPIFIGEYNIDYVGTETMMQTIDGAVFVSLYTYTSMTGRSDNVVANANTTMGGIWTIGTNSNYTIVNNDGSNVRPDGYVLGKLGRTMGGNMVQSTIGSGLSNLRCMACLNGGNWAVWLTNYDTNAAHTVNLQGLTGSYTYWECSPSHTTPLITTNNANSNLANLTLPSRSIVVLSNF